MLHTSSISDGNMHPSLSSLPEAQANFVSFCDAVDIEHTTLVGLRIDPSWDDGARLTDLRTPVEDLQIARGSVAVTDRIPSHGVILPRRVGAFVLSGDCYPVALVGTDYQALLHIGWRSARDALLGRALDEIESSGNDLPHTIHIGPGVHSDEKILQTLVNTATSRLPNAQLAVDGRDTYTSPVLFSKRAALQGQKARGNHVCILPAAA